MIAICVTCRNPFVKKRHNALNCSAPCIKKYKNEIRRTKSLSTCVVCKNPYKKRGPSLTCGESCSLKLKKIRKKKWNQEWTKDPLVKQRLSERRKERLKDPVALQRHIEHWRKQNKNPSVVEYKKKWHKNKINDPIKHEQLKKQSLNWYYKNKERCAKRSKEYYTNPDTRERALFLHRERARKHREANIEMIRARQIERRKNMSIRDIDNAKNLKRRQLKKESEALKVLLSIK